MLTQAANGKGLGTWERACVGYAYGVKSTTMRFGTRWRRASHSLERPRIANNFKILGSWCFRPSPWPLFRGIFCLMARSVSAKTFRSSREFTFNVQCDSRSDCSLKNGCGSRCWRWYSSHNEGRYESSLLRGVALYGPRTRGTACTIARDVGLNG